MEKTHIQEQILAMYNSKEYQELKEGYEETSIFEILHIAREENRHSDFLKWLLDPKSGHGLEEKPLRKFLQLLAFKQKGESLPSSVFLSDVYTISGLEIEREKQIKIEGKEGRIDIFISFTLNTGKIVNKRTEKGKDIHIILENKVYSSESNAQTLNYAKWVNQEYPRRQGGTSINMGVFLSPEEQQSGDTICTGDVIIPFVKLNYQDLLRYIIEPLLQLEMDPKIKWFLEDYINCLGRLVADESQKSILALSSKEQKNLETLFDNYKDVICYAFTYGYEKSNRLEGENKSDIYTPLDPAPNDNDKSLFENLWKSNDRIFQAALLYNVEEELAQKLDDLFGTTSNRDYSKYRINEDSTLYTKVGLGHKLVELYLKRHTKKSPKDIAKYFAGVMTKHGGFVLTEDIWKGKTENIQNRYTLFESLQRKLYVSNGHSLETIQQLIDEVHKNKKVWGSITIERIEKK